MKRKGRSDSALPGVLMALAMIWVSAGALPQAAERGTRDQMRGDMRQADPLKSSDPLMRLGGLVSLVKNLGKRAAPALIAASGDPDDRVRFKAIDLLGNLRVREAVPALVSNLALNTSRAEKLRTIAALGEIGDAGATDPLLLFLRRQDIDRDMRASAVFALGGISDARAREALKRISLEDPDAELKKIAESSLHRLEK